MPDVSLRSLSASVFGPTTGSALGAGTPATWSCDGPPSAHDGTVRPVASQGSIDIGAFEPSVLAYSGTAGSGVGDITIAAHASDSGARVTICPTDRQRPRPGSSSFWEEVYEGHQVGLRRGDNRFTVTVESADGTASRIYTLNVVRQPQAIDWASYDSVWVDLASDHAHAKGAWSDGTTMWFVDEAQNKLVAYTLANLSRDPASDVALAAASKPGDLWSDGTTVFVAHRDRPRIDAYDLAAASRSRSKEIFDLSVLGTTGIGGLWSDGTTMWVTPARSSGNTQVYAFDTTSGDRKPDSEIVLAGLGATAHSWSGMWSDGSTMFNVDSRDRAIYAHQLTSGNRVSGAEFTSVFGGTGSSLYPAGLWSDGTTMWVTEMAGANGYAGRLPFGARHVAAFAMKAN